MNIQSLPQDLEAERGLINNILLYPKDFISIADIVSPGDFFNSYHQQVWFAISELFTKGENVDLFSITDQLKKQEINSAPIIEFLNKLFEEFIPGNIQVMAKIIKNKSLLRQFIRIAQIRSGNAYLENTEAVKLLTEVEGDILGIIDEIQDTKPIDAKGINQELGADIEKLKKIGLRWFSTGFDKLDKNTGGLIPTHTWILGAYSGSGKTFTLLQIILNVLRQQGKVLLFSTEMDRKWNMLRLIGNIANISPLNILRGNLLENEIEEKRKAQEELSTFGDNLLIYDNIYALSEMRLKAKKMKNKQGVDLIVVDYIQNMRGKETIYERMSEAAIGLQQLAQETQTTVLIGSQISQSAAGWKSKESIDYKGAGEIVAVADVGLWMTKSSEDEKIRKIFIRKARHGLSGQFNVRLDFPSGRVVCEEDEIAGTSVVGQF